MATPQQTPKQVQDMFGDDASNAPAPRRRATPPVPLDPEPVSRWRRLPSRTIAGIALVVILVGTIVGIALAQRFRSSRSTTQTPTTTNSATVVTNSAGTNVALTNLPPEFAAERPKDVTTQDLDHDGLTNLEEVRAGTSLEDADSDHDNLTDYQEVTVYHTNPLQPDTDRDGFSDGHEVSTGNNPLGAGKLPRS